MPVKIVPNSRQESTKFPTISERLRALADDYDRLERAADAQPLLRRAGQGYIACWHGQSYAFAPSAGMAYLLILIDNPGQYITCTSLIEQARGIDLSGTRGQGYEHGADGQAMRDYAARYAELESIIADDDATDEAKADARAERGEIAKAVNAGRRAGLTGAGDRYRNVVHHALSRAMDTIHEYCLDLWLAIDSALTTGLSCRFAP